LPKKLKERHSRRRPLRRMQKGKPKRMQKKRGRKVKRRRRVDLAESE